MTVTFSKLGQMGRLGNQMFQIASTIGISKMCQTDFVFPPWQYEQEFNLHGHFADNIYITNTYNEPYFHFKKPVVPPTGTTDLVGFFQSYKYFEHCEEYIRFVFERVCQERPQIGVASMHVRRRDYVELGSRYYIQLANGDYYERAMSMINADHYCVFSDDVEWCKRRFSGSKFSFVDEQDPCVCLSIMASCEHNIIANSSFSWWGAFLNKNADKKVIAPTQWFGPELRHDTKDMIPNTWTRI